MSENVEVVRRLFQAVEDRDLDAMLDCYHPEVEINDMDLLPHGGVYRGHDGVREHARLFVETWGEYQSADEYKLDDTTYLETDDDMVVGLFRHRAVDRERGERLDGIEVGLYKVRDGKVAWSQMLHAAPGEVTSFLNCR